MFSNIISFKNYIGHLNSFRTYTRNAIKIFRGTSHGAGSAGILSHNPSLERERRPTIGILLYTGTRYATTTRRVRARRNIYNPLEEFWRRIWTFFLFTPQKLLLFVLVYYTCFLVVAAAAAAAPSPTTPSRPYGGPRRSAGRNRRRHPRRPPPRRLSSAVSTRTPYSFV